MDHPLHATEASARDGDTTVSTCVETPKLQTPAMEYLCLAHCLSTQLRPRPSS
jgi:hypothetical protein